MVRLRLAALIGLLALLPVSAYFLSNGQVVSLVLSAASVLLVVGSLWVIFGEAEPGDAHPEP